MSNNLESRVDTIQANLERLAQLQVNTQQQVDISISELRSSIATLADIVSTHEALHEESRRLHEESRQRHEESRLRHDQFLERFDRFVEQANQDRALMLQLIQAIAQGRNGN